MGTILVPHSAHYRGMSPPVQAAAAGGLLRLSQKGVPIAEAGRVLWARDST